MSDESRLDLLHYIDARFEATDKRFDEMRIAVQTAERAQDKRLDGMNEIRAQLVAQASTFATRDALDGQFKTISTKVDLLQQFQATIEGRIWGVAAVLLIMQGVIGYLALK